MNSYLSSINFLQFFFKLGDLFLEFFSDSTVTLAVCPLNLKGFLPLLLETSLSFFQLSFYTDVFQPQLYNTQTERERNKLKLDFDKLDDKLFYNNLVK